MSPAEAEAIVHGRLTVLESGCWTGSSRNKDGYSSSNWNTQPSALAHRAVWIAANGPIPDGMEIDHLCRNRPCCNPDHLEVVDHFENMARADIRRSKVGNDEQRNRLRSARIAARVTQVEIAARLGISQAWVSLRETERVAITSADERRYMEALEATS